MKRSIFVLLLAVLTMSVQVLAQGVQPSSARAWSYFPQIANGGHDSSRWVTTFTISNTSEVEVKASIWFQDDDGEPLRLPFGGAEYPSIGITIPAKGSITYSTDGRSLYGNDVVDVGWAIMQADGPVQGVATYRLWENNRPRFDVSVPATLPTVAHTSAATRSTAFALGNPYSSGPVDVFAEATSNSGQSYRQPITLPGSGHRAMSLGEAIPNLPTDFRGILELYSANNNEFAVLVLREADGIYSSLPSGHTSRPISHFAVLQDIFARLKQAWAAVEFPNPETIEMDVRFENEFNASGSANGVQFDVALSELFADSESEIAFVVAHEFGHVYQFRTGRFDTWNPNRELDADVLGMLLSLIAGYDPYAAAGALAKLHMVIGAAGLQQQAGQHNEYLLEILTGEGTLHGSFNERIDHLHKTIQRLCSLDDFRDYCDSYRRVFHPSFPPGLLLEGRDERRSTTTQEGFSALVPAARADSGG